MKEECCMTCGYSQDIVSLNEPNKKFLYCDCEHRKGHIIPYEESHKKCPFYKNKGDV